MTRLQACVVGGGPAGAAVASMLAARGWETTLHERAPGPRPKCCGECLAPRARGLLRALGLEAALEVSRARTTRVRVHRVGAEAAAAVEAGDARAHAPRGVEQALAGGEGFVVPRAEFDEALRALAQARGVRVVRGVAARMAPGSAEAPMIECGDGTHAQPALVVGADGAGSAVARAAGLAPPRPGRKFGVAWTWERGGAAAGEAMPEGTIEMLVAPGGYLGLVRRGDAVHAAALLAARSALAGTPAEVAEAFARRHPLVRALARSGAPVHAGGAGPLPWRPSAVVRGGGVALVGDAAGYAEPFTGEGMAWAFEGALLLGQAIDACGGWNAAAAQRYAALHARHIGRAQRRCLALAGVLERPRLFAAAHAAARLFPPAPRWLARQVAGA
ncbi:MAG: FAD-dependent monooxygenase [Phycisphaerales bacterium]